MASTPEQASTDKKPPNDDYVSDDDYNEENEQQTDALLGERRSAGTRRRNDRPGHRRRISINTESADVENWRFAKRLLIEAAPTLFLTVFGMVFTGELLERVSRWTALRTTDELFVLIPIINNLKGNLELNLSARLGTAANMGLLNSRESRQPLILGNLLLLQVQALLVSCAAAALSFFLGLVLPSREKMPMEMPQDSPPGQTGSQSNTTASVSLSLRGIVRDVILTALPSPMPRDSGPALPVSRTWGSRFRE
ncbi:hypothetical protein FRC01_007145 [Tulasnella sp. 417]|nr:hypothetical protein FRC01_007145 [Tulasnella sp. 417]